jgi:hypothetical protein
MLKPMEETIPSYEISLPGLISMNGERDQIPLDRRFLSITVMMSDSPSILQTRAEGLAQ